MMVPARIRLSLSLGLLLALVPLTLSAKEKTWTLYHAWKGHDFSKRGKVTLALDEHNAPTLSVQNDHVAQSLPLDDLYQLKLVEDRNKDVYTLTSVPACQVHRANFRDEISLTLNNHASVVSMAYMPLVSPLAPPCGNFEPKEETPDFSSKVELETATPGMSIPAVLPSTKPPPGVKVIPGAANAQNKNFQGEEQEQTPQSFLRRYWYILLPLFIMGMTSGAPDEQQGPPQQQGAGPQPQGRVATAAAPTASTQAASGAAPVRRRGKRG